MVGADFHVIVARFSVWWWTAGWESSAVVTFCGLVKFAGAWLLVELVCGETQEELLSEIVTRNPRIC